MRFGVCWYPEQWPEDSWQSSVDQMAELGLDLVRVGEFAWAAYEPERNRFEWGWLDRAMAAISAAGMKIVLGTPTATPPVWLMLERPSVLSVGPDGRRRAYGSRRHTCPTSAAYRDESARIVSALLDRYADHPDIIAWQIDNEPGNHDSARCWCDECHLAFARWLEDRFGTIDALNEAWGTVFWSQTYPDFASVRLPVPTMTNHHPSLRLAALKFASDQVVGYLTEQFELIRGRVRDDVELTTNFYAEDTAVDNRRVARIDGLASMDSYPHGTGDDLITAYHLDLTAGASGPDGRAWVMEQQAGPVNWTKQNPQVPDGQVRVWTWQIALHGYDALLYFRWRAARHGQEQYHSGLLRHDASRTGAFAEIQATIREIKAIDLAPPEPRIALVHSYKDAWAIEINPHREGLTHRSIQMGPYRAGRRLGCDVDVIDSTDDLARYEVVILAATQISTPERLAAIDRALGAGTKIVLGPRSLVLDRENAWSDRPLPAGLADRLGARVSDHLSQTGPVTVAPWGAPAGEWTDVFEVHDADVIATYSGGTYLDHRPAVVHNAGLYYAGFSHADAWTALLGHLLDRSPHPAHVEVFERGDRTFVIDHARTDVTWS